MKPWALAGPAPCVSWTSSTAFTTPLALLQSSLASVKCQTQQLTLGFGSELVCGSHVRGELEVSRPTQRKMTPVLGNVFKLKICQLSEPSTLPSFLLIVFMLRCLQSVVCIFCWHAWFSSEHLCNPSQYEWSTCDAIFTSNAFMVPLTILPLCILSFPFCWLTSLLLSLLVSP